MSEFDQCYRALTVGVLLWLGVPTIETCHGYVLGLCCETPNEQVCLQSDLYSESSYCQFRYTSVRNARMRSTWYRRESDSREKFRTWKINSCIVHVSVLGRSLPQES